MKASTFIKNANKKIMKRIEKQIKDENKAIFNSLKNKNKPTKFNGILSQITEK